MSQILLRNARLVATMDDERRELTGGWVLIDGNVIAALGSSTDPLPAAAGVDYREVIDVDDCLVTPGLVNTHHHLFQNLTRAWGPMTGKPLFGWLQSLYPLWRALNEEAVYASAFVGLAELALSGCTTSTDHLYLHPRHGGDLLGAEVAAAQSLGMRFHPTRGSMSLGESAGGLPPDDVVQDDETILAASEEAVQRHHDPSFGAMTRIALAPCSPFSVTEELMVRSAELASRLGVRLHTHFAENSEDDEYSVATFGCRPTEYLERTGWCTEQTWVAHCVRPVGEEIVRLGAARVGVAHCPSSNLILASGIAPVAELLAAGCPVGLGVDGSSSADSGSLWAEARQAMLVAKLRDGAAAGSGRRSLELATRGGAACLGRSGELGELRVGACADVAVWRLTGPAFAGAVNDPIEAWARCAPLSAWMTIVNGEVLVSAGELVHPELDDQLRFHAAHARRIQRMD